MVYVPGEGVLHQMFGSQVPHMIKYWTQSYLKFCKNELSKRSKINQKGGHWIEYQETINTKCLKPVK